MSLLLSTTKSANRCKPANQQQTIISYFPSLRDEPKRKRRNLEASSTGTGNTEQATAFDEQNVAVEKVLDPCQFDQPSDDGSDCLKLSTGLKIGSMTVSSKCSQQSDSELSDIIPPSPVAASNISLNTTCTGKVKTAPDQRVTTVDDASHIDAETCRSSTTDDEGLFTIEISTAQRLNHDLTSEQRQHEMKEVDTACRKTALSEGDEDECDKLLSGDVPITLSAAVDSELARKLPASKTDIGNTPEHLSSARRHFMEKSNKWKNVEFYMNRIESTPRGAKIEEILHHWKGDYDKLETHHGYIQWLFPIAEQGMNSQAQPLTDKEAEFIGSNRVTRDRMLRAYRMMLDFFGIEPKNEITGKLQRGNNWRERMAHLNRSHHNCLRITRMLKCFRMVDLAQLQAPLVEFLIREVFVTRTLSSCQRSCIAYWLPAVDSGEKRLQLESFMRRIRQQY